MTPLDFDEIRAIPGEADRVNAVYTLFQEDRRLTSTKAGKVEFITTTYYMDRTVTPGMRVLDLGAGTGAYSFYLAQRGCRVTAVELASANVEVFRQKMTPDCPIELLQGNALDLSFLPDASFDAVLVFGPLYHLEDPADQARCIKEALRVCKPDGTLFFSFIANDMVILTEFGYRTDYFKPGANATFDHETFQVDNFPFVFHTVDACRQLLRNNQIEIQQEIASDGMSELLAEKINGMDEESYREYLRFHFYCCEKPEWLGSSNHLLFVGKRQQDEEGQTV